MLVLGDSVMWGQGLLDDHKFSYRVREWICQQRNNGRCPDQNDVQIHVEAHSGAVIAKPSQKNQKQEERFTRLVTPLRYPGEVNHAYPTVWGQIELARRFYKEGSIPLDEVDLIIVNGGINDISAPRILVPLIGGNITKLAQKYCEDEMKLVLDEIAKTFPKARIVVPGYFPLVSTSTPENILIETIGYLFLHKKEKANGMGAIEEASTNPPNDLASANKVSGVLKSLARRSQEWTVASNAALAAAVRSFNNAHPPLAGENSTALSMRALFVAIPFSDDNAYAASHTFLWKLVPKPANLILECAEKDPLKKLMVSDELQQKRPCMCDQAGKGNDIACVRAAAFHPNKEGSEAYSTAIIGVLEGTWRFTDSPSGN